MKEEIVHPFNPIYNKHSKILILGSIASQKSREFGYPYAHPQNRFWKVMECLFEEPINNYEAFLLKNNIALWDVIKSCKITKSSDSSITDVTINDINEILKVATISVIFTNGKKATELYNKYIYPKTRIEAIYLPSTSPANAKKDFNNLVRDYSVIKKYL